MTHKIHTHYMQYALRLGARNLGVTAKNPAVGCVLVNNGHVVGVGYTHIGGRPHAETQAIAMAGNLCRGARAYVTLEPCAHVGTQPPVVPSRWLRLVLALVILLRAIAIVVPMGGVLKYYKMRA